MANSLTESVFSKDSCLSYKRESFITNCGDEVCVKVIFLIKLQAFTRNGNDEFVADSVTEYVFSKA